MKLTATREQILLPLQGVIGVVERKQTMPILANVLIAARGSGAGRISMTGTDLEVELVASGTGSFAALVAVAIDEQLAGADITGLLSTFVSDQPYAGQRLADMVPGILRDVGDVVHIASLVAPRSLQLHAPVTPQGEPLDATAVSEWLKQLNEHR